MLKARPLRERKGAAVVLTTVLLAAAAARSQPDAVHKTTLQQTPVPASADAIVLVRTVVDPGGLVAPHTHPGVEMAYVADGAALVKIAGRPDERLSTGGSFDVAPATVHSVHNLGPGRLTLISAYVVNSGKPIASPAR